MGGHFERFQGIDVQAVVNTLRQLRTDTGHGLEQVHRIECAAQALQLCPLAGGHQLLDCTGNPLADVRQLDQAGVAPGGANLANILVQTGHGLTGPAVCRHAERIGALLFEQVGGKGGGRPDMAQAGGNDPARLEQAIQLAWLAQQVPEEEIKHGSIGAEHINFGKSPDGDDVLKPRPEQIRILRDEIFTTSGPTSPAVVDTDPQELMQLENATISVLNGAGTPGLATRTTEYLAAQNVNVVNTGDAPEPYNETTIVSYTGNPYTLNYLIELMNISPNRIYNRYDPSSEVDFAIFLGYDWANTNTMP